MFYHMPLKVCCHESSTLINSCFITCHRSMLSYIQGEKHDNEMWKGYVLAGSYFVISSIISLMASQLNNRNRRLGMHLRCSLTATIYRKVGEEFISFYLYSDISHIIVAVTHTIPRNDLFWKSACFNDSQNSSHLFANQAHNGRKETL